MTATDIKYMQEALVRDMTVRLCEERGMSLPDALHTVYSSETYERLCNEATKLYAQSPVYLYDCLDHELKYGKIYV